MRVYLLAGSLLLLCASPAAAQESRWAVDLTAGGAFFVDEPPVEHAVVGAAARWRATPRLSVGPEFVFMRGPGEDRDVFITGKLVLDAMPDRRVSPYFVADGGVMLHRARFFVGPEWFREGAVSAGGGVRVGIGGRMFLAPEVRIGWEPHVRATITLGWRPD